MKHEAAYNISITPKALEQWRAELDKVDEEIKRLEQRRNKLSARIDAVQFFIDDEAPQVPMPGIPAREVDPISDDETDIPITKMGVPDAIRFILKKTKWPMKTAEIKNNLRSFGYPMEKLGAHGAYFYTVLSRMKKSEVISRDGDKVQIK